MITIMAETLRLCTKCMTCKPVSEFSTRKASADGLNRYCKTCMAKYYQAHKGEQRKRMRARNKAFPEKQWALHLRQKYDMTIEEYNAMVAEQGGKCKICNTETKLVVDHNHATGKVRGLLCKQCNYAVTGGVEWAKAVVYYLETYDG